VNRGTAGTAGCDPAPDAPPRFEVRFVEPLARDGGEWAVYVTAGIDQSVNVVYDEDSAAAVAQMEHFLERAQDALAELRRKIAEKV
jgi:hypothetical protein